MALWSESYELIGNQELIESSSSHIHATSLVACRAFLGGGTKRISSPKHVQKTLKHKRLTVLTWQKHKVEEMVELVMEEKLHLLLWRCQQNNGCQMTKLI